jgi:hypothetical protein
MLNKMMTRVASRRGVCRAGHEWTDRATPVACSHCGRVRRGDEH